MTAMTLRRLTPLLCLALVAAAVAATPPAGAAVTAQDPVATTLVAGQDANWTFTFSMQATQVWPGDGSLDIDFPDGFDVSDVDAATVAVDSDPDPTPVVTVTNQTVTIDRQGGAAENADLTNTVAVTVRGVTNGAAGSTGTFAADWYNSTGAAITSDDFDAVTLTKGTVAATLVATNTIGGDKADYTFTITPSGSIAAAAKMDIAFPTAYVLTSVDADAITVSGTKTGGHIGTADNITIPVGSITGGIPLDIVIKNVTNPAVTSAASAGTFTVTTLSDGDTVDEGTTADLTLHPRMPSANIVAVDPRAGFTDTYQIHFSLGNDIPAFGSFAVTFPTGYVLSANTEIDIPNFGTETGSRNGRTVIANLTNQPLQESTSYVLHVTNVTNPGQSGPTGVFILEARDDNEALIERRAQDTITLTAGGLEDAGAAANGLRRGQLAEYTFTFNVTNAVNIGDDYKVRFPAGYVVPGRSDRTATTAVVDNVGAGGTASFIAAAFNPDVGGTTGSFTLWTADSDGDKIDEGTAPGVIITEPTTLPAANLTVRLGTDRTSGAPEGKNNTVQVTFTPSNTIPAGGRVQLALPVGYTVDSDGTTRFATAPAAGGTLTTNRTDRTITVTLASNPYPAGTAVTFNVTNIGNPAARAAASTFTLDTWGSDEGRLDRGTEASPAILAGALTGLGVTADSKVVGANATYTFNFTTVTKWPADGQVQLTFSTGFAFRTISPAMEGTGAHGTLNASIDGTVLTLERQGTDRTWIAGPKSLTIGGAVNPATNGTTGDFDIILLTGDGEEVDVGTLPAITILDSPDDTPPAGRITLSSSTHIQARKSADACPVFTWDAVADGEGSDVLYHWAVSSDEDYEVTTSDASTNGTTVDLCVDDGPLAAGVQYFHIRAKSDGGLGAVQTPFVLNIVRITANDLDGYIRGVTITVDSRDDGNLITWKLPNMPIAPQGVQVWRSTSPYTLLTEIESDAFTGEYLDTTVANADKKTAKYLVTMFFGKSQDLGWYSGVGSIAPDTADYPGVGADATWPWWVWVIIVNAVLAIIGLVLLMVWLVTRKRGEKAKSADGLIDLGAIGQQYQNGEAPVGLNGHGGAHDDAGNIATDWPQDIASPGGSSWVDDMENDWATDTAPAAVAAIDNTGAAHSTTEEHDVTCPACSGGFTVEGHRPLHTTCPHCGVSGVLN